MKNYLSSVYNTVFGKTGSREVEIKADIIERDGKKFAVLTLEDYATLAAVAGVEPEDITGNAERVWE